MYCYEFDCYERAVRVEDGRHGISTINCYVHLGLAQVEHCTSTATIKLIYMRMLSTLEEAICDPLLSIKWRKQCLRVNKQLMPVIFEMLNTSEYQALSDKLTTLSDYFLPLNASETPTPNK